MEAKVQYIFERPEMQFLSGFLSSLLEEGPPTALVLEYCNAAEMYRRYLSQFTIIGERQRMTWTAAEIISIKRLLNAMPTDDDYTDIMRNNLISIIEKQFPWT